MVRPVLVTCLDFATFEKGHVPADLIRKVLADRPVFAGLAVPGMPNGAPGMEGATKERYEVVSFTRTGETNVYAALTWHSARPQDAGASFSTADDLRGRAACRILQSQTCRCVVGDS